MRFRIEPAMDKTHRYVGVFTKEDGTTRRIPFGDATMDNYTIHHNPMRRANYLSRHRTREDWNKPMTAGALSRWILWNTQDLQRNVSQFRRRFNLQ